MPTGDLMRATIEGHFDGEPVVIGLGFLSSSEAPDFATDATNLASSLGSLLALDDPAGGFLSPLSVKYVVDNIRISDLNPGVAASLVFPQGGTGGNTVDDGMPPNDALCVTWRTGLKGKQNRGRSYLTGFAEDSQSGGYWIGEIQTWAQTAFVGPLLDTYGEGVAGPYVLSLVHTVSGGARIIPPTSIPIISANVHNEVRTLRRRAVGVRISRHRTAP